MLTVIGTFVTYAFMEMDENTVDQSVLNATMRLLAEELLAINDRELSVEDIQGMAFALDPDLNITTFNQAAQDSLQYEADELKGRPITDFLSVESTSELESVKPALLEMDDKCYTPEFDFIAKSDSVVPNFCYIALLGSENGFFLTTVRTVHHDKDKQQKIRDSIAQLSGLIARSNNNHLLLGTDEGRVKEEVENVRQNVVNPLYFPVRELAAKALMSESKFRKIFKSIYGISFEQFINQCLIDKAKALLLDPDMQVKRVAQLLRYSVPSFILMFKKKTGETPGAYYRKRA